MRFLVGFLLGTAAMVGLLLYDDSRVRVRW